MSQTIFEIITRLIKEEIKGLGLTEDDLPQGLTVESPKNLSFGDISTNISFLLARRLKSSPLKIATDLAALITPDNKLLEKVEIAGGGFLNFFLAKKKLQEIVVEIEEKGALFGSSKMGAGRKVLVEFVSANPTGPLHIGHGRGAVLGDTLANIFSFLGYQVSREYYVNDAGRQIKTLGERDIKGESSYSKRSANKTKSLFSKAVTTSERISFISSILPATSSFSTLIRL